MKKIIILSFLFAVIALPSHSQFYVNYRAGFAQHDMGDMKNAIAGVWFDGIELAVVDNFPSSFSNTLDIGYRFTRLSLGLTATFMNTGGQLSYADYSGSIRMKMGLQAYQIGLFLREDLFQFPIKEKYNVDVYVGLSPAFTISRLKETDILHIEGYGEQKESETTSVYNIALKPFLGAQLQLNKNIFFNLELGYDWHFNKKLAWNEDFDKVKSPVDWSGFRVQAGVGYSFQ